jgi:lipopolysaccharide export system protein LptC
MDGTNWPRLLLLLVAAVASVLLVIRNTDEQAQQPSRARLGIGYYMTDAELVVTGADGRTHYRVRTRSAVQDKDSGTITLDRVFVEYDPLSEVPWDLRADAGHIPPDRNIIELRGDVVAETKDDDDTPITIRTDILELDTETYIAQTDSEVAIRYAANQVFATGIRAYFKEDRLQLLADVNGKFHPETVD